jgi:hypothetical protein
MATNDDLDDFFKKKDRKGNKHKKQTGLLTNNEELLKQLGNYSIISKIYYFSFQSLSHRQHQHLKKIWI